ncbi:MAG: DNA alkylation repair protein [Chloroflexota bacterium]|nr:DNA alkylation repair protein [Chloroflexota bacterium]
MTSRSSAVAEAGRSGPLRPQSPVTARARAFVAVRLPDALRLGRQLGAEITDPDRFAATLEQGLRSIADTDYQAGFSRMAPGVGPVLGVRAPLVAAVARGLRRALAESPAAYGIYLAERLIRSEFQEVRLFAHLAIARSLPDDPERSWQLIRRLARRATDWDSVDHLADLVGQGILLEPRRWAEVEQLVYSPHRWERRLVGSTLATLPFALPRDRRAELAGSPGLALIESLIGDNEPDVQKALSWALRSWREVDPTGVAALLRREARVAAETADGHRAWVIRDALSAQPPALAAEVRELLATVRRRAGAPSTSRAAELARMFSGLPGAHSLAEPPLSS